MASRKELEQRAAAILFGMAERSFRRRSEARAERLGERLGLLLFKLDKKHRERTRKNLAMAFPEWPAERVESVAQGVFRHFGRVTADFMRTESRTNEQVIASIQAEGMEHFTRALEAGRGVVLVTGHFGNWERMAQYLTAVGLPVSVVARDANQEGVNDRVLKLREKAGVEVLSRGNAARMILSKLKKNTVVGILPDQNAGDIYVPFFGKPCGTVQGPAVLSERTGAAVIAAYCTWEACGRYRIRIGEPLVAEPGFEPIEGMTRAINASLEAAIRRHPEQWLWMHDRWKSARKKGLL